MPPKASAGARWLSVIRPILRAWAGSYTRRACRRTSTHRKEVAPERVEVAEHSGLKIALIGQKDTDTAVDRLPGRVIALGCRRSAADRGHLGVVALLAKISSPKERAHIAGRRVIHLDINVLEIHPRLRVHARARIDIGRPPFVLNHDREAIGVKEAPFDGDPELAPHITAEKIELGAAQFPYCVRSSTVRRTGRLLTMLMTPPLAKLPYKLDVEPSTTSMRSTLSMGTRVQ